MFFGNHLLAFYSFSSFGTCFRKSSANLVRHSNSLNSMFIFFAILYAVLDVEILIACFGVPLGNNRKRTFYNQLVCKCTHFLVHSFDLRLQYVRIA